MVNYTFRKYYCNYNKSDRTCNEIGNLKQTGTVQQYVNNIHWVDIYVSKTTYHLINIILNYITPYLPQAMVHYEDVYADLLK